MVSQTRMKTKITVKKVKRRMIMVRRVSKTEMIQRSVTKDKGKTVKVTRKRAMMNLKKSKMEVHRRERKKESD